MGKHDYLFNWPAVDVYREVLKGKIKIFPRGFWMRPEAKQNAAECTRYLIEEILKWDNKEAMKNTCANTFIANKLAGMLVCVFGSRSHEVMENAYPGKFKPWEFNMVPRGYWTLSTTKEATIWLIEEKLKWTDEEVKRSLSRSTFLDNGVVGMTNMFKSSPFSTIDNAYPGKFKEWELASTPNNYWNEETAKKATIWLIEEKLKWTDEEVKKNICRKTFVEHGLRGMSAKVFGDSTYAIMRNAYPDKDWSMILHKKKE